MEKNLRCNYQCKQIISPGKVPQEYLVPNASLPVKHFNLGAFMGSQSTSNWNSCLTKESRVLYIWHFSYKDFENHVHLGTSSCMKTVCLSYYIVLYIWKLMLVQNTCTETKKYVHTIFKCDHLLLKACRNNTMHEVTLSVHLSGMSAWLVEGVEFLHVIWPCTASFCHGESMQLWDLFTISQLPLLSGSYGMLPVYKKTFSPHCWLRGAYRRIMRTKVTALRQQQ